MTSSKKKRFSYAIDTLTEEVVEPSEQVLPPEVVEQSKEVLTSEKPVENPKSASPPFRGRPQQREAIVASTSESVKTSKVKEKSEKILTSELSQQAVTLNIANLEGLLQPPQQRGKRDTEGTGRMAIPREQTTLRLRPELKRAAAAAAALQGITLGDLIEQALVDYLSK